MYKQDCVYVILRRHVFRDIGYLDFETGNYSPLVKNATLFPTKEDAWEVLLDNLDLGLLSFGEEDFIVKVEFELTVLEEN